MKDKAKQLLDLFLHFKFCVNYLITKLMKKVNLKSNTSPPSTYYQGLPHRPPLTLPPKSLIKDTAPVREYLVIRSDNLIIHILWSERYRLEEYEILGVPNDDLRKQCPRLN